MPILRAAIVAACSCLLLTQASAHDAANQDAWVTEAVTFRSADGFQLSGTLVSPRNDKPVAAVVLGPGGVPGERYVNVGALMALRGSIAVLTYDKRGTGQSKGVTSDPGDISAAKLAAMAADAAAAMHWINNNRKLQKLPRGFVAISQSGWVIPLAVAASPEVNFLGFWSGPGCTTSEQLHFQNFSEARGYDRSRMTNAEISEAMKHVKYRPDDVDPLAPLKNVSIPALWLFGEQDPWVPIELSTSRLQALIDQGKSNFKYQVFPGEAHDLADSSKQPSFIAMIEWIKKIASSGQPK